MTTASALHRQVEDFLAERIPSALSPRPRVDADRFSCGFQPWDELLKGGLEVGVLTEFVGTACSGRSTLALAYMAAVTRVGSVCAWVDVADALDPEAASANGADLERLLWVRCGTAPATLTGQGMEAVLPVAATVTLQPRHTGSGSPHPRSEGRDMPQAIGALLQAHGGLYDKQVRRERRAIGTPGAPNRPLSQRAPEREEQVASDRRPPRRGEQVAVAPRAVVQPRRVGQAHLSARSEGKPWQALDQALRATDLLLQAGGFSAIVLDLGSTPAEFAWRIPLATWFRFRAACDRTRTSLLLLTQHPCARSSAGMVVRLEAGSMEAEGRVMTGIRYRAEVERQRFEQRESKVVSIRKPPQAVRPGQWTGRAAWVQGR